MTVLVQVDKNQILEYEIRDKTMTNEWFHVCLLFGWRSLLFARSLMLDENQKTWMNGSNSSDKPLSFQQTNIKK